LEFTPTGSQANFSTGGALSYATALGGDLQWRLPSAERPNAQDLADGRSILLYHLAGGGVVNQEGKHPLVMNK